MGNTETSGGQPIPDNVNPLLAPLQALQELLSANNDEGVIIGGIAASILGRPRFTADLDAVFLMSVEDIPQLLEQAYKYGIEPRISDTEGFARKNRVLLLRHVASGTDIDVSLGILPFEIEMVQRSTWVDVGPIRLRLPTPEDLIILKAVAHRPKDLADIQAIAESHPNFDKERVRFWVEQFGEALEMPELWNTVSHLF